MWHTDLRLRFPSVVSVFAKLKAFAHPGVAFVARKVYFFVLWSSVAQLGQVEELPSSVKF